MGVLAVAIAWLENRNSGNLQGHARVIDGDSLNIDGQPVRLMGIDAPELDQLCQINGRDWQCGRAAVKALRNRVSGQSLQCATYGPDKFDRLLAICRLGSIEINAWMVEEGWAVDFGGYPGEESTARRTKAGIWQGSFEFPVDWRRAHKGQLTSAPHSMPSWLAKLWFWFRS